MSRYSTKPGGIFKSESLTYYVLPELGREGVFDFTYSAFDSHTSALLASAETLESLAEKMCFLGYTIENKEPKL